MTAQAHTERAHATLAPSGAARWLACPGSVQMSEGIPDRGSVFAAEGTAAHMLAERCLSAGCDAARFKGQAVDTRLANPAAVGAHTPDGEAVFPITAEMVDGVQTYLDVVTELAETSDEFEIEQRMDMSALVPGVFGTGDAIAYNEIARRVTIVDLKYGKGVAVEVEDNAQMLTYAMGVAQRYHNRGVSEVELVVVQPRAPHRNGPVRRWHADVVTLYEHVLALQVAAERAAEPNAALVPGLHCTEKFCKAAAVCPALRARVDEIIGATRIDGELMGVLDPRAVPLRDWKHEAEEIKLVMGYAKRREEFAHAAALAGDMPPGAKLVAKRATRRWKDEGLAAEALQLVGVDESEIYELKMLSPAQVEKAIPKKERGVIGALTESKSSGTVLAPLDDPRPAVDASDASGFDAVEIEER